MKTYIRLAMVLALALTSWWFQNFLQKTPLVKPPTDEHFPDYFLENFTITSMNANGKPAYILKAKRLQHFADDGSTEISFPIIEFKEASSHWKISADRATILQNKDVIHLYDNVIMQRMLLKHVKPLSISTGYLKINTVSKIAETDQQARIKMQDFELDTLGMVFNSKLGILKLKSNVKGFYASAQ